MPQDLTPTFFADCLQCAQRVYWPGCAGHSALFERWWGEAAAGLRDVTVGGVWIPGVNKFDPTSAAPGVRAEAFFALPELRAASERGQLSLLPLHYSEIVRRYAKPAAFDLALLQVSPPDDAGRCSLSVTADFASSVLQGLGAAGRVLAHVNPRLPRVQGPWVDVRRIDAWVQADEEPLQVSDAPATPELMSLARQVAALVPDGATLQFGLGRLQAEVLAALQGRRGLRVHSGMVSDGLLGLLQAEALAPLDPASPPVCAATALGGSALYEALADPALARFAPVTFTHAESTLAALQGFVSINSALEVDLFGNVNAEWLRGRQVSGVGGLVDFVRGARAGAGGRSIIALTSQAGTVSRIVPRLAGGTTAVARADVDTIVTEHGVAVLRDRDTEARAQALIAIAAPHQREALRRAWHTLKTSLIA